MQDFISPEAAFQNVTLFAAGVSLVGSGVDVLRTHIAYRRSFRRTTGTVTKIDWPEGFPTTAHVAYQIDVEFRTDRGIRRTFSPVLMSNFGVVHEPGESLDVWYPPAFPENAQVHAPAFHIIRGVAGLLAGFVVTGWVVLT